MIQLNYNAIQLVWQYLFGGINLLDDEYVEVVYDSFNKAKHFKNAEELEEFVRDNWNTNITIVPCTKIVELTKLNKRTGKFNVSRQRIVILDVEDPANHSYAKEREVKNLLSNTIREMPPEIQKAIVLAGYTGGGGQIWLKLSRWVEKGEIDIVYSWLSAKLKDIKTIDQKCLKNPAQSQRLLGTINWKYRVETKILKVRELEEVEGLNVDFILKEAEALQELEERTHDNILKLKDRIKNISPAVEEIKRRIRFTDIDSFARIYQGNGYINVSCPFHPPDNNPSFSIFVGMEGWEIGYDHHTGEAYDVIKYYQERYGKSYEEALRELAQKAGVKLEYTREGKKAFEEQKALAEFDPYEYVAELGIDAVEEFKIDNAWHYRLYLTDKEGTRSEVVFPADALQYDIKSVMRTIHRITNRIAPPLPEKGEKKAWHMIYEAIRAQAQRIDDIDTREILIGLIEEKIVSGITENKNSFRLNQVFCSLVERGEDGEIAGIYIHPQRLLKVLKDSGANIKGLAELIQHLKALGCIPVRKRVAGMQFRLWQIEGELLESIKEAVDIDPLRSRVEKEQEEQKTITESILETENTEEPEEEERPPPDDWELPF